MNILPDLRSCLNKRMKNHYTNLILNQILGWASLVAQCYHWICLPVQETQVQSLGQEDPLGGGNGKTLQYSCQENPMDRGPSSATVHGVAKSWTRLSNWPTTTDTRPGPEAPESNTQRGSCPSGSHNLAGKIEKS